MEMVPFPVRPFFRVLALGLAAVTAWVGFIIAYLAFELASVNVLFSIGSAFFALALFIFACVAGSIAATASLPRMIVGADDDDDAPTGAG